MMPKMILFTSVWPVGGGRGGVVNFGRDRCPLWLNSLIRNEAPPSRDPIQSIHLSTGSRGKGQKELFDKLLQT